MELTAAPKRPPSEASPRLGAGHWKRDAILSGGALFDGSPGSGQNPPSAGCRARENLLACAVCSQPIVAVGSLPSKEFEAPRAVVHLSPGGPRNFERRCLPRVVRLSSERSDLNRSRLRVFRVAIHQI
jgi:hypothetical protein